MSLFITFEGVEGSGKTTQVKLLQHYLESKGLHLLVSKEPGGTEVGEKIREILLHNKMNINPYTEVLLYLASRSENTVNLIMPALQSKKIVIVDRYSDSTLAYQISGRNLPEKIITEINTLSTRGLIPDLTFLLDFDPEIGLLRIGLKKDRIERENIDFHLKVRAAYKKIARQNPERIVILDASKSKEEIHKAIITKVSRYLPLIEESG